jgi:cytochrome c
MSICQKAAIIATLALALLASANCSRCHAIGKTGASPNPKSPPLRTLAKKYPLRDLEEAFAEGIEVGHGAQEMPEFVLEPVQIDALLAYIGSLNRK